MKLLNDKNLMKHYIDKFQLDTIFDKDMSSYMKLFLCEKGEMICKIGDELEWIYFLVKGKLKVFNLLLNGKSTLLRFSTPLSIVGDLELFKKYKIKNNVEALNEAIIIGIKADDVKKYASEDSLFLRFVIENLSHKLYTFSNLSALNQAYPFINRFASYLIAITSDENNNKLIDEIKTNNLTELANFFGVSYRHLNRVIKDLCDSGIIKKNNKEIVILDYERLKDMSGGHYE